MAKTLYTLLNKSDESSVQSFSPVWLFVTPWTAARQTSLSMTNCQSSPKPMCIELPTFSRWGNWGMERWNNLQRWHCYDREDQNSDSGHVAPGPWPQPHNSCLWQSLTEPHLKDPPPHFTLLHKQKPQKPNSESYMEISMSNRTFSKCGECGWATEPFVSSWWVYTETAGCGVWLPTGWHMWGLCWLSPQLGQLKC